MKKSVKKYQHGGTTPTTTIAPTSKPKGYIKMSPSAVKTMPKFPFKSGGSVGKSKKK